MIGWRGGLLLSLAALSMGGCAAPIVTVDHNTQFNSTSRDALVVFGFNGEFNVQIEAGVDDGVNWVCPTSFFYWRVRPEKGFVVVRLPARTGKNKYAVARFDAIGRPGEFGPLQHEPIQKFNTNPVRPMWVFNAEAGKVNYVGALRVNWVADDPDLAEDSAVTAQHAEAFVAQTFPNIRDHVVTRPMQWIYTGPECTVP